MKIIAANKIWFQRAINVLPLFILKFAAAGLTFIFHYFTVRTISPEQYGVLTIALSCLVFMVVFAKQGIEQSVVRFFAPLSTQMLGPYYLHVAGMILKNSIFLAVLVLLFAPFLQHTILKFDDTGTVLWIVYLFAIAQSLLALNSTVFKSRECASWSLIFSGIITYCLTLIAFLFIHVESSIEVLLILAGSAFIAVAFSAVILHRKFSVLSGAEQLSKEKALAFKNSSKILFWASLCSLVVEHAGVLIMGRYESLENIGIYGVVFKVSLLMSFPLIILNIVNAPKFARYHSNRQHDKIRALYKSMTLPLVLIATVAFVFLCLFSKEVLSLFGQDYIKGEKLLLILAIGQWWNLSCGPVVSLLVMSGHEKYHRRNTIGIALFSLALMLFYTPVYGSLAVAIITAMGLILLNLISLFQVHKYVLKK